MKNIKTKLIVEGDCYDVYEVTENGKVVYEVFYENELMVTNDYNEVVAYIKEKELDIEEDGEWVKLEINDEKKSR